MAKLSEIYQLEDHVEEAARTLINGACELIYVSQEASDLESNRVEIQAVIGANINNRKRFSDGSNTFNAWNATVNFRVVTNRTENAVSKNHSQIRGNVRSLFNIRNILKTLDNPVIAIVDCRDAGTQVEVDNENNLDISTLSFIILFNIRNSAWETL